MAGPPGAGVVAKVLSSDEGREAVEGILDRSKGQVERLLVENRHLVEALRDALLDRDELVGQEIVDVISHAELRALGMLAEVDLTT
jgi:ATP-dependent Zn protease